MDAKTDEQHEDEGSGANPDGAVSTSSTTTVSPAAAAETPAQVAEIHEPTCESCDKPATKGDRPVTATAPLRRGFCADHSKESPKRTIEFWAKAKGMTPRMLSQGSVHQSGTLRHAKQNPKHADFHRARAFSGWPMGFEITEADFDKAVKESATPSFR